MKKEIYKEDVKVDSISESAKKRELILFNDEFHTFDYVIDALVDVCSHSFEQATQCTMITHYKGQCEVKKGYYSELKPLKQALVNRQLRAKIN
jgi:ATP-dependent Clp protease adaptor protein ClpS